MISVTGCFLLKRSIIYTSKGKSTCLCPSQAQRMEVIALIFSYKLLLAFLSGKYMNIHRITRPDDHPLHSIYGRKTEKNVLRCQNLQFAFAWGWWVCYHSLLPPEDVTVGVWGWEELSWKGLAWGQRALCTARCSPNVGGYQAAACEWRALLPTACLSALGTASLERFRFSGVFTILLHCPCVL